MLANDLQNRRSEVLKNRHHEYRAYLPMIATAATMSCLSDQALGSDDFSTGGFRCVDFPLNVSPDA